MKRSIRGITMITAAAAVLLVGQAPAHAVNRYTVKANTRKPANCKNVGTVSAGAWLTNKDCGYWVGTAMAKSSYDVSSTDSHKWHFGRSHGKNDFCAWITPGALNAKPTSTTKSTCGSSAMSAEKHRLDIGKDFNAQAHHVNGGSDITVRTGAGCKAYYNYFTASDFRSGHLHDTAGTTSSTVGYRYTTRTSSPAMVVDDAKLGWVFMSRGCVTNWRGMTFHNDND